MVSRDPCRFSSRGHHLFRCAWEQLTVGSSWDSATRSDACLRGPTRSSEHSDGEPVYFASYGDAFFLVVPSRRRDCVLSIEFKRLSQRYVERLYQLIVRGFLAVHPRNFFYPTNPPIAVLLYYGRVLAAHRKSSL